MGTLIRYLMAYAVQLAWQRSGKSGATPPMRMPFGKNKGKTMPLPIIGPWQMMIAMWLARQIWAIYGGQFKDRLRNMNHPVTNHIHNLLPDAPGAPPTPNVSTASSPAASTPANAPAPRPPRNYGTQPLSSAPLSTVNGSGNLPPGSVLNSLRRNG